MLSSLVGIHPSLKRLKERLAALASADGPLVITGEPGVGKSLFASHIQAVRHPGMSRFPVADVALLQDRDQRITLFGGEPPELTTTRRGILEFKTTILIKNIDAAQPHLQDLFATALSEQIVQRFGSTEANPVQARILLTLHAPAKVLARKKRLTDRLLGFLTRCRSVTLPPLRKRHADIPLLVESFHQEFSLSDESGSHRLSFRGIGPTGEPDPELSAFLSAQPWRGNVTELKSFIYGLAQRSYEELIHTTEMQQLNTMLMKIDESTPFSLQDSMSAIRSSLVSRALKECSGSKSDAARLLGLSPRSLHRSLSHIES